MEARAEVNHVVVIGGGPAGCGMLCCAATRNRLRGLLDRGLVLLEASPDPARLGGGAFAEYGALRSNSHGSATSRPRRPGLDRTLDVGRWYPACTSRCPDRRPHAAADRCPPEIQRAARSGRWRSGR